MFCAYDCEVTRYCAFALTARPTGSPQLGLRPRRSAACSPLRKVAACSRLPASALYVRSGHLPLRRPGHALRSILALLVFAVPGLQQQLIFRFAENRPFGQSLPPEKRRQKFPLWSFFCFASIRRPLLRTSRIAVCPGFVPPQSWLNSFRHTDIPVIGHKWPTSLKPDNARCLVYRWPETSQD